MTIHNFLTWKAHPLNIGRKTTGPGENDAEGPEALSNAELLAILINNGTRDRSAVDVCKELLRVSGNDLNAIGKMSVKEMLQLKVKGIGQAKAIGIVAALELGIRRDAGTKKKEVIMHSRDIAAYLQVKLQHKNMRCSL